MNLNLNTMTFRVLIIAFAIAVWADATDIFGLDFKWIYPPSIDTDGGPTEWHGFPFPYSIDAQYTSNARNSMPHIWLLNVVICTALLGWALYRFLPKIFWQKSWSLALSWIGMILIVAYLYIVWLFWAYGNLRFVWNADPYRNYEDVSVFDLGPHFGAVHEVSPLPQSNAESIDTTKTMPDKQAK